MNRRKRFGVMLVAWMVMAVAWAAVAGPLAGSATAQAGSIVVRGTFLLDSWELDCILRPDGVYKCTGTGSGPFYGGITGTFSLSVRDVFTPPPSPFFAAEAKGVLICDPCTVAGLSGSIVFSIAWTTSNSGKVVGPLAVKSAGGQLTGLTGAGSFWSTAAAVSDAYLLELSLPA